MLSFHTGCIPIIHTRLNVFYFHQATSIKLNEDLITSAARPSFVSYVFVRYLSDYTEFINSMGYCWDKIKSFVALWA